jgi:hypothetical protein
MLDHFTGEKVDVRTDAKCGPYIMIEPAEISRVEEVLRRHGIRFMLEDGGNGCKGTPEAAVIEFETSADTGHIQRVLDSVV